MNKKAVIVEDEAEVVRYIFEQYAHGEYVKNIVKELNARGITHKGKCFINNTVYNILKNERYAGIYHHNGEVFDNIYPRIVPQEVYDKVQIKVQENKQGKRSDDVNYLLKNKVICGYCGKSIIGENGTARNGERRYYYKCRGRKMNLNGCQKTIVRKEILENIVIDAVIEQLNKPPILDKLIKGILQEQERQAQNNTVLNLLMSEKLNTDNAIRNIMTAIEKGVITNTTTKRLKELEAKQEELEKQILVERSKAAVMLKENDIRQFYLQALKTSPQLLINTLVKQVILFDDKVQIYFNTPLKTSPDTERQGFSFFEKYIKLAYKLPFRKEVIKLDYVIELMY